jgi:hypothetical protein
MRSQPQIIGVARSPTVTLSEPERQKRIGGEAMDVALLLIQEELDDDIGPARNG